MAKTPFATQSSHSVNPKQSKAEHAVKRAKTSECELPGGCGGGSVSRCRHRWVSVVADVVVSRESCSREV